MLTRWLLISLVVNSKTLRKHRRRGLENIHSYRFHAITWVGKILWRYLAALRWLEHILNKSFRAKSQSTSRLFENLNKFKYMQICTMLCCLLPLLFFSRVRWVIRRERARKGNYLCDSLAVRWRRWRMQEKWVRNVLSVTDKARSIQSGENWETYWKNEKFNNFKFKFLRNFNVLLHWSYMRLKFAFNSKWR